MIHKYVPRLDVVKSNQNNSLLIEIIDTDSEEEDDKDESIQLLFSKTNKRKCGYDEENDKKKQKLNSKVNQINKNNNYFNNYFLPLDLIDYIIFFSFHILYNKSDYDWQLNHNNNNNFFGTWFSLFHGLKQWKNVSKFFYEYILNKYYVDIIYGIYAVINSKPTELSFLFNNLKNSKFNPKSIKKNMVITQPKARNHILYEIFKTFGTNKNKRDIINWIYKENDKVKKLNKINFFWNYFKFLVFISSEFPSFDFIKYNNEGLLFNSFFCREVKKTKKINNKEIIVSRYEAIPFQDFGNFFYSHPNEIYTAQLKRTTLFPIKFSNLTQDKVLKTSHILDDLEYPTTFMNDIYTEFLSSKEKFILK